MMTQMKIAVVLHQDSHGNGLERDTRGLSEVMKMFHTLF